MLFCPGGSGCCGRWVVSGCTHAKVPVRLSRWCPARDWASVGRWLGPQELPQAPSRGVGAEEPRWTVGAGYVLPGSGLWREEEPMGKRDGCPKTWRLRFCFSSCAPQGSANPSQVTRQAPVPLSPHSPRSRGTGTAPSRCCVCWRCHRSLPRAPALSLPGCFSALISQTAATHKGEGTARTLSVWRAQRHTGQIYSSERGLCLGQARMLLPSSCPGTAQKWWHKSLITRSGPTARAGGVSAASSELAILFQHLDPITQHLAGRAGA